MELWRKAEVEPGPEERFLESVGELLADKGRRVRLLIWALASFVAAAAVLSVVTYATTDIGVPGAALSGVVAAAGLVLGAVLAVSYLGPLYETLRGGVRYLREKKLHRSLADEAYRRGPMHLPESTRHSRRNHEAG